MNTTDFTNTRYGAFGGGQIWRKKDAIWPSWYLAFMPDIEPGKQWALLDNMLDRQGCQGSKLFTDEELAIELDGFECLGAAHDIINAEQEVLYKQIEEAKNQSGDERAEERLAEVKAERDQLRKMNNIHCDYWSEASSRWSILEALIRRLEKSGAYKRDFDDVCKVLGPATVSPDVLAILKRVAK